jgi:hypothetical protein
MFKIGTLIKSVSMWISENSGKFCKPEHLIKMFKTISTH